MRNIILIAMITMFFGFGAAVQPSYASSMGEIFRQHSVDGYVLNYNMLDMAARKKMMGSMEGMDMPGMSKSPDITNHLVVSIKDGKGKAVSGKVGFFIISASGKEQKTLTMGMHGGYGADVSFKEKGVYKIQTKAVIDGKTLVDDFSYEVK